MNDPILISDITSSKNFITEGDVSGSGSGYTVLYYFLDNKNELSASNGYDTITGGESSSDKSAQNIEYHKFSSTLSSQKSAINYILGSNSDPYSVFFTDVLDNIDFEIGAASTAQINIGQVEWDSNGNGPSDDDGTPAYIKNVYNPSESDAGDPSFEYNTTYYSDAHGDIWFNSAYDDGGAGWGSINQGDGKFYTILHEFGHALGLKGDDYNLNGTDVDNQKYTIMSYNPVSGMNGGGANVLYAYGLQLYDILALQEIYGSRNFATRTGDTTYSKTTAFASSTTNDAFIYTIWDGGGEDTISAEGFYESGIGAGVIIGAEIDLRQGAFSSIGSSVLAARATDNVAIAFHTIIENAIGSVKDDIIIGNAWDNILNGGEGDDYIYGDGLAYDGYAGFGVASGEYDMENGDDEAPETDIDQLFGGSGNDILFGGRGSDILHGGANTDTADYSKYAAYIVATTVDAAAGNYTVDKWYDGSDPFTDPADDTDTLYSIEMFVPTIEATNSSFIIDGYGGVSYSGDEDDNNIQQHSSSVSVSINGQAGDDFLAGSNYEDYILGGAGDDFINGKNGSDKLLGGAGEDRITGSDGNDYMDGGEGNDYLSGGQGDDLYVYSGGDDIFDEKSGTGSQNTDVDTIRFQNGIEFADLTFARYGNDIEITVSGGNIITLASQNDHTNIDLLEFHNETIDLADVVVEAYGTSGNDNIKGSYSNESGGVHYYASASIDDVIYGLGGDDSIDAYEGNNTVFGGDGDDYIRGGDDSDLLYGEGDDDRLNGENGNDFLYGGDGVDELYGGWGSDVLYGGAGNDELDGYKDNDILYGDAGDDILEGGSGADIFVFLNGDGQDTITDFNLSANDVIDLSGYAGFDEFSDVTAALSEVAVGTKTHSVLSLSGSDTVTINNVLNYEFDSSDFLYSTGSMV